jgi:hypothetical protein
MPSSNPPPDRFQREIEDVIRLAERRLEHQSFSSRMRRSTRRLRSRMGGVGLRMPPAETLGGLGLAFLMLSWFLTLGLLRGGFIAILQPWVAGIGILLLVLALLISIMRPKIPGAPGANGGPRMWRGERISYSSAYGEGILSRLRRMLRGR